MRQLQNTEEEKAMMLDIIVDNILNEYGNHAPIEKKYHSRAENAVSLEADREALAQALMNFAGM